MSHAGHSHGDGHDHDGDMKDMKDKTTEAPTMSDMPMSTMADGTDMTTAAAAAAASKEAAKKSSDASASSSANAGGSHAGHDSTGDNVHMMMSPFLFTRKTGFFILFREALVNSTGGFVGALIACFVFGALTSLGMELGKRVENRARRAKINGGAKALPLTVLGSIAHGFRLLLHYIAMLIVMTMNVWIIIAVLLGHALGFFIVVNFVKDSFAKGKGKAISEESGDGAVEACDC